MRALLNDVIVGSCRRGWRGLAEFAHADGVLVTECARGGDFLLLYCVGKDLEEEKHFLWKHWLVYEVLCRKYK